jgi:hypothetical protein
VLKGSCLTKNLTKVLAILIVLAVLATGASAQSVSTQPALVSVGNITVAVGQEFTVPVRITGVSNLYGYDVRLPHDTAMLQGVRVDHGGFLNQPWYVIRNGFYAYGGRGCVGYCAWYALTSLNPALPKSGNGTLVYVTYRALQPGTVTLNPWVQLGAPNGTLIPATVQGGTVTVVDSKEDR